MRKIPQEAIGLHCAIEYITQLKEDYEQKKGLYNPTTDVTELSSAGEEYIDTLLDIRRGLKSLVAADAARAQGALQNNLRETFEALCAMRDTINEHIPLPSLESDLLQGPETSVFCSVVAEAVITALQSARAQGAEVEPVKFPVGTQVEKSSGYQWPGEVRSVFTTKNGHLRYVVECTVVEVAGALHIYSETQLRSPLTTPPAPQPTDRERVIGEILQDLVLAVDNDQNLGDIMRKVRAALAGGEA